MKRGFIDETTITVVGGKGGNGIVSFLRERNKPFGGPNGGNGGSGGSVFMMSDSHVKTLLEIGRRHRVIANKGEHGMGGNRYGARGDDVILRAPIGTQIYDVDTGALHADLVTNNEKIILATGGNGGFGNNHYKSSANRAPRFCSAGIEGEERQFRLELRLLADVGLVGLPNAGKSSLLRAVSAATPKVASYPFTTLSPQLGVIAAEDGAVVTIADVPGLIGGAAEGAGLGNRFLRHLTRTALLCQVVDMSTEDPVSDCAQVHKELAASRMRLSDKPRWLVLNKSDMVSAEQQAEYCHQIQQRFSCFSHTRVVSALARQGTKQFSQDLLQHYAPGSV